MDDSFFFKTNKFSVQEISSPQTPTMKKETNQRANPKTNPASKSGAFLTRFSSFQSSLRYASVSSWPFLSLWSS
jgi:hypothetical protein